MTRDEWVEWKLEEERAEERERRAELERWVEETAQAWVEEVMGGEWGECLVVCRGYDREQVEPLVERLQRDGWDARASADYEVGVPGEVWWKVEVALPERPEQLEVVE